MHSIADNPDAQREKLTAAAKDLSENKTEACASKLVELFQQTTPFGYRPDPAIYALAAASLARDTAGRAPYPGDGLLINQLDNNPTVSDALESYCWTRASDPTRTLSGDDLAFALRNHTIVVTERARDVMDAITARHPQLLDARFAESLDTFDQVAIATAISAENDFTQGKYRQNLDIEHLDPAKLAARATVFADIMAGSMTAIPEAPRATPVDALPEVTVATERSPAPDRSGSR